MIRILAVDDDIHMLKFVAAELRQTGYELAKAASGEQIITFLSSY